MIEPARGSILAWHHWSWAEPVWWLLALSVYFLFPQYLPVATSVVIMTLFAVSYDLVIGFTGILTLGHAMYFGLGAYAAALIAKAGWTESITGVLAAGAVAAAVAAAMAPFILRLVGLPLIMVTMGVAEILFQAANEATSLTGGDDGLSGFRLAPLFGLFRWTIFGQTQFLYALGWLFVLFYLTRRLVASPFGVALQGIRENRERMLLIGTSVLRHRSIAYVISAATAGIAGALLAQTSAFAGLGMLSFSTTLEGLVMVVLGGVGTLYGALVGAPVYMLIKYFVQQSNPYYWMFVIGSLLIVVVRFSRGGLFGLFIDGFEYCRRRAVRLVVRDGRSCSR